MLMPPADNDNTRLFFNWLQSSTFGANIGVATLRLRVASPDTGTYTNFIWEPWWVAVAMSVCSSPKDQLPIVSEHLC